ncbi:unnamed protein product, partial [Notodromas monacha]
IEYLARHRGADDHLRPASRDLEWYQVYMLDIWALVVLIIAVYVAFLVSCCRFLFCCSRGGENKVTSKRQKVSGSHPKTRAFITHGGMLGTQEASYHGVPMIGFPMGADQHLNLVKSVRDGVAVKMDWGNYSAETIVDSVTLVINDPSYKSNVMKRKQLLHDQPESPLQRAVWWIEYLARHRGADDHLRPASRDLEWYQVYMLDIWALVVLIIAVYLAFLVSCCRFLFCCSRGGENKVTSKRQKVDNMTRLMIRSILTLVLLITSCVLCANKNPPTTNAPENRAKSETGSKASVNEPANTAQQAKQRTATDEKDHTSANSSKNTSADAKRAEETVTRSSAKNQTQQQQCYKIFIVAPFAPKGDNEVFSTLAAGLAARCHQVTSLVAFPVQKSVILPKGVKELSSKTYRTLSDELRRFTRDSFSRFATWDAIKFIWEKARQAGNVCERFLADPLTKRLLTDDVEKFDILLLAPSLSEECQLIFAQIHKTRFNTPWVHFITTSSDYSTSLLSPNRFLDLPDKQGFLERSLNAILTVLANWVRVKYAYPKIEGVLRREVDPTFDSLEKLEETSALLLLGSDEILGYPAVRSGQEIQVGGLQCREPKPLSSEELESWYQESGQTGVLIVGLGFTIKELSAEDTATFATAFGKIKQKVLWESSENSTGLPKNVRTTSALTHDMLGHPKTRAIITTGSVRGTQEACYHGIPILALLTNAEQRMNIHKVVRDGIGISLSWANLTTASIINAVNALTSPNNRFKKNILRKSRLMKNQMTSPLDRAIWWLEFVAREKDTRLLRPAIRDMPSYQVHLVDVASFLVILLVLHLCGIGLTLLFYCRCRNKRREVDKDLGSIFNYDSGSSNRGSRNKDVFKRD